MHKFTLGFVLFALFVAAPAHAATIALSAVSTTVAPGTHVTVTVSVNPQGQKIAAVKSVLSYPENLLTPDSFTFAPSWIAMTQHGYDQMAGGTIIKSGGYPGGFATTTILGTVTFTAKAVGDAQISVQNGSAAYSTGNANLLSGAQGSLSLTIASLVATSTEATSTGSTGSEKTATSSASTGSPHQGVAMTAHGGTAAVVLQAAAAPGSARVVTALAQIAPEAHASTTEGAGAASSTALTAAAVNAVGTGALGSVWLWVLVALAVLGILAGAVVWYRRRIRELQ